MSAKTFPFPQLPFPGFFDPADADDWGYFPNVQQFLELAVAWRRQHNIQPASLDVRQIQLLIIDAQKDFCFPSGALFVAGLLVTLARWAGTR